MSVYGVQSVKSVKDGKWVYGVQSVKSVKHGKWVYMVLMV